jgi:hypothetical protein
VGTVDDNSLLAKSVNHCGLAAASHIYAVQLPQLTGSRMEVHMLL